MKNIFTIFFSIFYLSLIAQTQQNINKTSGTVSNLISDIDSIRFDSGTNQMVVVTNSGSESHALVDITNVTFSGGSNLAPCSGGITSVTDIDGNTYPVVQIGNQCWTAENLRTTKYNNDSVIPNVTDDAAWSQLSTPAWCNYENNPSYDTTYGKLYNWYTVAAGNMCPTGWHVPSDAEWSILINYLDPNASGGQTFPNTAGGKMKTTTGWAPSPDGAATNESGFSGLPGGSRNYPGANVYIVGNYGVWWSSTEINTSNSWFRVLDYSNGNAFKNFHNKQNGFSVRCLKD